MSRSLNPQLLRPLACLDVATTGPSATFDRIIEIQVTRFAPDGNRTRLVHRLNPGVPIPASATALHHISDQDVVGRPPFETIAVGLEQFLQACDLCGSGIRRIGLPSLMAEFSRVGIRFSLRKRAIIDIAQPENPGVSRNVILLATSAVLAALLMKNSEELYPELRQRVCHFRFCHAPLFVVICKAALVMGTADVNFTSTPLASRFGASTVASRFPPFRC
jgi:hypothetical protein